MHRLTIPAFLACLAAVPLAFAGPITLGLSNQTVTFTGIGGNANGQGQSKVTWGNCTFDGTNTRCLVSGPFTGLANGGTYNFLLTYPGNGSSPLTAISNVPGGDFIFFNLTAGSFTTSFTETDGTVVNFYDLTFTFLFSNSTCTGVPSCAVGQVGLTPTATITGPISGTFNDNPVIRANLGVITASDYGGGFTSIAPGTWIEIFGTNLGTTLFRVWGGADFKGIQAPTALDGTTVTVGGKPAFVYFVSPGQVDVQVPSGLDPGAQDVVLTTVGGSSIPYSIKVNATQPGLLSPPTFKLGAGQYVTALFQDGVTYVLPPGAIPRLTSRRAKPGDAITLYGVGFGPVVPDYAAGQVVQQTDALAATFKASFGGVPATVLYAGFAPGYVGLYQFNVVVPNVPASDSVPFTFSLGGTNSSQTLIIAVQN